MSNCITQLQDLHLDSSDYILCYGHFSTIHLGHIRYLKEASSLGYPLVVAVIGDKSRDFAFDKYERSESLNYLGLAQHIILLDDDELDQVILKVKPRVLILGNEFETDLAIKATLELQTRLGGKIKFHTGSAHYSNADLLNSNESDLKLRRRDLFLQVCKRNSINLETLISQTDQWGKARLLVLGDIIVDQYLACEAIGMSAEAPVVVVRELDARNFLGGAGVVAAHIRALGATCHLISVIGDDDTSQFVHAEINTLGIQDCTFTDTNRPTTFKKRYVVDNQKLFRVSRLEDQKISTSLEDQVISRLEELAPDVDGIVISDFNYGVVTPSILDRVTRLAKDYGIFLFGDLQCSSQVGDVTRFKDFSLLSPNEKEARMALQDKDSSLEQISLKLLEKTNCARLLMKLGSDGFIAYDTTSTSPLSRLAFPALSVNPVDVAGAGDSLLAVMATGISSRQNFLSTAALGCCMASLAVEVMGNSPITVGSLRRAVSDIFSSN